MAQQRNAPLLTPLDRNKEQYLAPEPSGSPQLERISTGGDNSRRPNNEPRHDKTVWEEVYDYSSGAEWFAKSRWGDFQRYWVNDGPKLIFVILYFLVNIALFTERFIKYYNTPLYSVLGFGICFARGAAQALKFNCAAVLLPVCRNLLSWLRGTWLNNVVPFDKAIVFHKHIAFFIGFWTAVHVVAHMFNWHSFWNANVDDLNSILDAQLTSTPTPYQLGFMSLAGWTGHVAVLAMVLMYTTSIEQMRRPFFETFWYTHHLFVVFYAMLFIHGLGSVTGKANFWIWCTGPAVIYIIERIIRIIRGNKETILIKAIQHPSKVIELQMRKADFFFKPGQYLYLNIPYFASHEWHPFTISSAPSDDLVSVHIRIVGDWTGALYNEFNPYKAKTGVLCEDIKTARNGDPILRIDGPFGAASEDIWDYKYLVLVAAGIGVTPFASILKTLNHAYENANRRDESLTSALPKKVYFIWIARDKTCFEWFSELLQSLEEKNSSHWLDIRIFFTGHERYKPDEVKSLMRHAMDEADAITGLSAKTNIGRPRWKDIFQELKRTHEGQTVGVFYCGPSVLSKQLYKTCRRETTKETKFKYKKENF